LSALTFGILVGCIGSERASNKDAGKPLVESGSTHATRDEKIEGRLEIVSYVTLPTKVNEPITSTKKFLLHSRAIIYELDFSPKCIVIGMEKAMSQDGQFRQGAIIRPVGDKVAILKDHAMYRVRGEVESGGPTKRLAVVYFEYVGLPEAATSK
jgi:hypothetical protein